LQVAHRLDGRFLEGNDDVIDGAALADALGDPRAQRVMGVQIGNDGDAAAKIERPDQVVSMRRISRNGIFGARSPVSGFSQSPASI
jgi:hypothetical protein